MIKENRFLPKKDFIFLKKNFSSRIEKTFSAMITESFWFTLLDLSLMQILSET